MEPIPPRKRQDLRKGDRHKPGRKGDRHKPGRIDTRTPEAAAKRKAEAYANYKSPPFLAIDGEGWGRTDNGVQYYQLMIAANDDERYVLDTGKPLETAEILEWLALLPKGRTLISFSFGYDVTMLTKTLPTAKKIALVKREERPVVTKPGWKLGSPKPVYHNGFAMDWLPRKYFSINGRMIYDTWSFFGKSLLETLKLWDVCTAEEMDIITAGKERRPGEAHDRKLETEYCTLENKALCRVMTKIRDLCRKLGYPLTSYYGAGSVANAVLKKHSVDSHAGVLPESVRNAAQTAFFGGRFETASLGEFNDVYYYDIVSAYPTTIRNLPCLACGEWTKRRKYDPTQEVALWHVAWGFGPMHGEDDVLHTWGPLPWRSDHGLICYPAQGEGWYHASEVSAALEMYPSNIAVLDGWSYETACDHRPFAFVDDLFKERAKYKSMSAEDPKYSANNGAEQLVLKLGLNSLYGKTAQSIGNPKYANPVWAGMVTAGTRATLLGAIAQAPEEVLSTATDSISSRVPLNLPIGKELGQWEHEAYGYVFIAGDGMSYSPDHDGRRTRTRGIGAKDIVWDRLLDAWRTDHLFGSARFKITRFEGLAVMVARGKPDQAGRWHPTSKKLRFGGAKRQHTEGGWTAKPHNTSPTWLFGHEPSTPYRKNIGIDFSAELALQADAKDDEGIIFEAEV
jgi:hypothetical protein